MVEDDPFAGGTVHRAADDVRAAIVADRVAFVRWQALTPLGRNEFLCWIEDARQPATRARRIERTRSSLIGGKRRPCCWAGCIHRPDKVPGRWQQAVLIDAKRGEGG